MRNRIMSNTSREMDNRLYLEDQVADIFQRAKSGEPFGTKEDINALIDKLCDHIHRKLIEESWCPCDSHSINQGHRDPSIGEKDEEGYMQRIRRKVLEILTDYLATFKSQLFTKYGSEPTDPLDIKGEDKDTFNGCVSGEPSSYTMANTDSFLNRVDKSQTSGMQSVINTNVCDNSLSDISINDWVSVGRCLSRDNYFDQSPRLSVSASPATSRWGLDSETSFGTYRKTRSCTAATPAEIRTEHDDTRRHPPGSNSVTSGDELNTMPRETFKKTSNKKLIKKSHGSKEKTQQMIKSSPLLTDTEDFHADHFKNDKDAVNEKDIDVRPEAGAAKGDGNKGTSSLEEPDVSTTYVGGVPIHLYYHRGSVDSVTRRKASNRSPSMNKMRRKAKNVVQFFMQLRKPV